MTKPMTEAATQFLGEQLVMTKEMYVDFATYIYGVVKAVIDDEQAIINCIFDHTEMLRTQIVERAISADKVAVMLPQWLMTLSLMLESQDGKLQMISGARWVHYGLPQISMGHKFVASLLVTNATEEVIRQVQPPFPSFMIEVPNGLLTITNPHLHREDPIRRIMVLQQTNHKLPEGWSWSYHAYADSGATLYRYGVNALELLPGWIEDDVVLPGGREFNDEPKSPLDFELSDTDKRMTALVGKLIVNTCLAFSDPTKVKQIGPGHAAWQSHNKPSAGNSRSSPTPTVRVFQVGHTVKHDFREYVRDYVSGARKKMSVQVLVCGHFKGQHHGPKNSLFKTIWREPFWRGPEDAPIAVRSHSFEKSE